MPVDWAVVATETPRRMHADELAIDADLVRTLLAEQLPELAALPLQAVAPPGTVHAMFRLGDDLAVRLPRRAAWAGDLDRERVWLSKLRDRVSVQVPEPVAHGRPTERFPLPWAVYRWLTGDPYHDDLVADEEAVAEDVARFISELRRGPTVDAPATGRRPLSELDELTRSAVAEASDVLDVGTVTAAWDRALTAPLFSGAKCWIHTDLLRPNLLVGGGRLVAVIDFGNVGVGDPAADVIPAWTVFGPAGRRRFRQVLDVDDGTWERARGYALTQAALIVPYYRVTNPSFTASALRTIHGVLDDVASSSF